MAGPTGLEPATSGVTGRRSNQLSYAPAASTWAGTPTPPAGGCQGHRGSGRSAVAYGTDRTESPAANHRVSVDEFKPGEDDADGDDHHAAEADCHVAFEKFDVRSELSAQRREIGL